MQTKDLQTWEELKIMVKLLAQYRDGLITEFRSPDTWVFRGQRDSEWHLETTLERITKTNNYPMQKYFRIMKRVRYEISDIHKLSSINWDILDSPQNAAWFEKRDFLYLQGLLNLMIFLRHHGFPSPLLDWTNSIEVAGHFAFQYTGNDEEKIAIFALLDHTSGTKGGWLSETNIFRVSPDKNIEANLDSRHKNQKAAYTYCSIEENNSLYYSNHETVFLGGRRHKFPQDILWKFTIPTSERDKVIKELESKFINTSELFDSVNPQEEAQYYKDLFIELDQTE